MPEELGAPTGDLEEAFARMQKEQPPPVDRSQIGKVESALEEAIITACEAMTESHLHDADAMEAAAKGIAITFGCWRSLQVELDRYFDQPQHGPVFNFSPAAVTQAAQEALKRKRDENDENDETPEEDDNG